MKSLLISSILLWLLQIGTVHAQTDWTGAWVLAIQGDQKELGFAVVSESNDKVSVKYYNRLWEPQDLGEQGVKNGNLVFLSTPHASTFRFELVAGAPGKAEGTWNLIHPQGKKSGRIVARRAVSVNNWDPFDGLRAQISPNQVIDLNKFLLDKAPRSSLPEFIRFWHSTVEPQFFVPMADLLYGKTGEVDPDFVTLLKPIFELVRKKSYRELSVQTAADLNRIVGEIKLKHADFYRDNPTILMPSLGGLKTTSDFYNGRLHTRIGLDAVAKDYPGKALKAFLAKEELKLVTYHFFPPSDKRLGIEFIREGLASYLTVSQGFAASPDAYLNLPAGTYQAQCDNLGDYKKRLLAVLEKKDDQTHQGMLGIQSAEARTGLMAAYRYGEMVWSRSDLKQVATMGPRGLILKMRDFLNSEK
jgi:hypothetical protein